MLLLFNHFKWSLSHTLTTLIGLITHSGFHCLHRLVMLHHHVSSPRIYYKPASLSSDHSVFVVSFLVSARCLVCDCFRKPPLTHWPPAALCPQHCSSSGPRARPHTAAGPGLWTLLYHISSPWLAEPPPVPWYVRAVHCCLLAVLCVYLIQCLIQTTIAAFMIIEVDLLS